MGRAITTPPGIILHPPGWPIASKTTSRFGTAWKSNHNVVLILSDQGVTFEHLRGPFQSCVERFEFVPLADGAYEFEHQGTFVMRGGSLGWLFGILVIRGVFDRHVAKH